MAIFSPIFRILIAAVLTLGLAASKAQAVLVEGVTPSLRFKIMRVKEDGTLQVSPVTATFGTPASTSAVCGFASSTLVMAASTGTLGSAFFNNSEENKIHLGDVSVTTETGKVVHFQTDGSLDGGLSVMQSNVYCRAEGNENITLSIIRVISQ
jgi:hypothetical protein